MSLQILNHDPHLPSTDEIVLGPPKTSFASSRNITKLEERDQEQDSPVTNQRSRFFRDRENTKTTNGRDWRSSKAQEDDDALASDTKFTPRQPREGNGFGQRLDQRWSRDNNDRDRERERDRERDRERPSQRGGWREREKMRNDRQDVPEKDPEWMDEPVEKENKGQMHTQEEFEAWKERMKASKGPRAEVKEEVPDEVGTPVKSTPAHSKPQTPLVTDAAGFDKMFGGWGDNKRLESPVEARTTKTPALGKGKSSRFASVFALKEEPRPAAAAEATNLAANDSSEEKQAFAGLMSKLREAKLEQQMRSGSDSPAAREHEGRGPPPGPPPGFGVASPPDALSAMFDKAPASTQSPRPQSGFASDPFMPPPSHFTRPTSNVASPNPASMRPDNAPSQMQSIFLDQSPRNGPTPDSFNAQHSRKPNSLNKDSEFLLNLIQAKNANRPPPPSRTQHEPDNFQLFLDQPPKMQTAAPKPQAPRPTEPIEVRLFGGSQHPPNMDQGRPRAPPGFIEDPSILHQQAQRSYPNGPPQPRRPSAAQGMPNAGPGAPQDFPPNFAFMNGPPPPGAGDRMPPPPGFNPNIRHPPGFFQQPNVQPPPQQAGGIQGPPPGYPPGMPLPGFGAQGPPPPPGFFGGPNHVPGVPPGFGPPGMMMMMPGNGIRSPDGTGMRSPQEGPGMGMPMLQGMGAGYGRR